MTIDNKLDFKKNSSEDSYLSKIIMDEENKLNQFSNIGFQKHLSSVAEIELIDKMKQSNFENCEYRNLSGGIVAIHSGWKI